MNTDEFAENNDMDSLLLFASKSHKTLNKLDISLKKSKVTENLLNNVKKEQKLDDMTKEYLNVYSEKYISEFSKYNSRITDYHNQISAINSKKCDEKLRKEYFKKRVLRRLDTILSKQKITCSLRNIPSIALIEEEENSKILNNSKNTLYNSNSTFKKSNFLQQRTFEHLDTSIILSKGVKSNTELNLPVIRGGLKLKEITKISDGRIKKIKKI